MALSPLMINVLLTAAVISDVTGSAITLTTSESSIKPLVTSNLTVTCALRDTAPLGPAVGKRDVSRYSDVIHRHNSRPEDDDLDLPADENTVAQTTDNVQFVTSMLVSRDGVDLATVSEHFPISQLVPGFTVTGHLTSGAGERGRLQLTFAHPTQADAGTYRCDIATLSSQGHAAVFSQTVKVMEEEVSLNDLVKKLQTIEMEKEVLQVKLQDMEVLENKSKEEMQMRVDELKAENAAQNKTLQEMKISEQQLKNEINELKTENAAQNNTLKQLKNEMQIKINELKTTQNKTQEERKISEQQLELKMEANNSALNRSLESLRAVARVEPDVFFTAILTSRLKEMNESQVVVYDRVLTNEGAAYNNITGKFTCPKSGFYHFEVHALAFDGWSKQIGLRHNGNIVVAVAKYGDDESEFSYIATLKASQGDIVDVAGTSEINWGNIRYHSSTNSFSGRLLALT